MNKIYLGTDVALNPAKCPVEDLEEGDVFEIEHDGEVQIGFRVYDGVVIMPVHKGEINGAGVMSYHPREFNQLQEVRYRPDLSIAISVEYRDGTN